MRWERGGRARWRPKKERYRKMATKEAREEKKTFKSMEKDRKL